MPTTTSHGLIYPGALGSSAVDEQLGNLATSLEAALDAWETWLSWSLVWQNGPTALGAGGVAEAFYQRVGNRVHAEFRIEFGTSPTFSGSTFELLLPVPALASGGEQKAIGRWLARDDNVTKHYAGAISCRNSSGVEVDFGGAWHTTDAKPYSRVSSSAGVPIPGGWAAGDVFSGVVTYLAAG